MNNVSVHIVPFSEVYNEPALAMEKRIVQGTGVRLEIQKAHFLSRALVFKTHYACLAINAQQQITGAAAAARTTICLNGKTLAAGIAFDTKVVPAWRKKGIGRQMAKQLYNDFFKPQQLYNVFLTAKTANVAVVKLSRRTAPGRSLYPFVYLSIPSTIRLPAINMPLAGKQLFHVQLFDLQDLPPAYYTNFSNGLGCFYTNRIYGLKINKISMFHKAGIALLKLLRPSKYASLPREGDQLLCAALFGHCTENIAGINTVLEKLQLEGIDQLLVCCRKGDAIYRAVKEIAIYRYQYFVAADFELRDTDELTIDARCL